MPPITRLQVNAEINNKIRNKSASDKVNNVEDADSRILMMDYVDQEVAAAQTTPDATDLIKGKIQLTGDLGGTAASPTVPELSSKVNLTANQSIDGVKTFVQSPQVPSPDADGSAANKLYVDNLIVTKTQKTTITEAQILALNSSPVIVLPNTEGKIKYPTSCMIIRNGAGTSYSLASNLYISTTATGAIIQIPQNTLTTDGRTSVGYASTSAVLYDQSFFPLDYTLAANVSDPTAGTGDIDVYVTYVEITLT